MFRSKILGFVIFLGISLCGSIFAADNPRAIAVLEFENNSGKTDYEHLKKGIRDMITTDISKAKDIFVVERAMIDQVFKELKFTQSVFFDKGKSVEIGKLIGATYLLTGSYFFNENSIRIDVRLVDVRSGIIAFAEKVQGQKKDFFDLEKVLVTEIIKKIDPNISTREMRRINQYQTENFAVFDKYSLAIYEQENGDLSKAIRIMSEAAKDDPSFSLAQEKLRLFGEKIQQQISSQKAQADANQKTLSEIMDQEFHASEQKAKINDHSSDYYLALISLAVHHGLRSETQRERDLLLQFWREFSAEPQANQLWPKLKEKLKAQSLQWEKQLMKVEPRFMYLTQEAQKLYSCPRVINIWPFCHNFIPAAPDLNQSRNDAINNILPHNIFTDSQWGYHYQSLRDYSSNYYRDRTNQIFNTKIVKVTPVSSFEQMNIEASIAAFYVQSKIDISEDRFNKIIKRIVRMQDKCYGTPCAKSSAGELLKRFYLIASAMKDSPEKLEINEFTLYLVKLINDEAIGDTKSTGMKISEIWFKGDNFIIIAFLPDMYLGLEGKDYKAILVKSLRTLKPSSKFNIITSRAKLFDNPQAFDRKNMSTAIDFLNNNIYKFNFNSINYSVSERVRDALDSLPKSGKNHLILLVENQNYVKYKDLESIIISNKDNIIVSVIFFGQYIDRKSDNDLKKLISCTGGEIIWDK